MIRRIKFAYAVYNFFHKEQLKHNIALYKRVGLRKKYYTSISSKDFVDLETSFLDENFSSTNITETAVFKEMDDFSRQSILDFEENGFLILKNYVAADVIDKINLEIENGLAEKRLKYRYGNKIMCAFEKISILKQLGTSSKLTHFLSTLIKGQVTLFQSINFLYGSEQKTHSDSIHMTTYPLGGLLGVWIALEDIELENGPLHYYPGSHKLPYYLNSDYDNEGNTFLIGNKGYTEYEKMIEEKIIENNIQKEIFTPKKGDILVWHANLFHGGEKHLDKSKTRKSVVFHYFKENYICYHEITQRPSLFKL